MVYLDTNVFIYASVEQCLEKKKTALKIIKGLVEKRQLKISTLVVQEMIFTLAKLGVNQDIIRSDIDFYLKFLDWKVSINAFLEAVDLSFKVHGLKNINDLIHLKIAENFCEKLITFDQDFEKFRDYTKISIEILK